MKHPKHLIVLTALLLISASAFSATINVPADETTIQAALDATGPDDTVLVAPGIYYENVTFPGHDVVLASHYVVSGDSADIVNTIIDGSHLTAGDLLGSVVRIVSGESLDAMVIGFTIQNGIGEYSMPYPPFYGRRGGGILIENNSSASILHNVIRYNSVSGNYTDGAGLCFTGDYAYIYHNEFFDNQMNGINWEHGGGIYIDECLDAVIRGNVVRSNSADGVALYFPASVMDSNFIGDNGDNGIWTQCEVEIKNNVIVGNHNDGIYSNYSNVTLVGNVIYGNDFCGVESRASHFTMINNTIAHNQGWAIYKWWFNERSLSLRNNIIWGNRTGYAEQIYLEETAVMSVSYCDIEGGQTSILVGSNSSVEWNEGNIDSDPLFVDPNVPDLSLTVGSPCIDAGDPDPTYNDPDGTRNDMGALYHDQTQCCAGIRGNIDGDPEDVIDALDLHYLVDYLAKDGPEPPCMDEADVNGDGVIDRKDLSCLARHLYSQGNPCQPADCE